MGRQRRPIEYYVDSNNCHICTSHFINNDGYPQVRRNGKLYNLHRYIYEERFGDIPTGMLVCHKCDNPACINPEHLWLGTFVDNMADKIQKRRQSGAKGMKNFNAKLTESDVLAIIASQRPRKELAKDYKVVQSHISMIKCGLRWKHLIRKSR